VRPTILLALLTAILVAACSQDRGQVYPVPLDRVRQILSKTDLPGVFFAHTPRVEIQANKPSEVAWVVSSNGYELMRYVATLSDTGQGRTRVALELKGAKGGEVEKCLAETSSIRNLYMVAMEEQIASAIEERSFDLAKMGQAFTRAAPDLIKMRQALGDAIKASAHRESLKSR